MPPSLHNYDVLEILGSGSFGTCYKVQHITSKDVFVWKAVDYSAIGEKAKGTLCSELMLLSEINNQFIVKYFSHIVHDETNTLYIVMEWCGGGDLSKIINEVRQQGRRQIEECTVWRVLADVARALDWLHTHALLHGNLKPSNIFKHAGGSYKLGDLSLAARRRAAREGYIEESFIYHSPEMLKGQIVDAKSDIWALGCVAFELCCLSPPYTGSTSEEVLLDIKAKRNAEERLNDSAPLALSRIIGWMLSSDNRPAASAVARHPSIVSCAAMAESQQSHPEQRITSDQSRVHSMPIPATEAHRRPEEISYGLFQTKWVRRLEDVRGREARASAREKAVSERERRVASLERRVASLEKRSQRSRSAPRVRKLPVDEEPSYCAAPGDASFSLTTAARLDPTILPKPNFPPRVRFRSDSGIESGRESKLSDHDTKASGLDPKLYASDAKNFDTKPIVGKSKWKSGRESKLSGRESKTSGRESKMSGRESKLSNRRSTVVGPETKHSSQASQFSNQTSKRLSCNPTPTGFCTSSKLQLLQHPNLPDFGHLPAIRPTQGNRKSTLFSGSPEAKSSSLRNGETENEVNKPKLKSPKSSKKSKKLFPQGFRLYKWKKDKIADVKESGIPLSEATNCPKQVPTVAPKVPNWPQQCPVGQNQNACVQNANQLQEREKTARRSNFFVWEEAKPTEPCLSKPNDTKCSTLKNAKNTFKVPEAKAKPCPIRESLKLPGLKESGTRAQSKCVSLSELRHSDKSERRKSCYSEPPTNRLSTYLAFGGKSDEEKCRVGSSGPQLAAEYAVIEEFNNVDTLSSSLLKVVNLR